MCAPPLALAIASGVMGVAGAGLSAAQGAATANYQAQVATRNAQLDEEAARTAQESTRLEAQRLGRQQGQREGQQVAAMAANGVDLGTGSALAIQQDTAATNVQDLGQLYRQGDQQMRGYDISASNDMAKAAAAKQQASGAILKGVFDAGNSVLGAASQYSSLKARAR